MREQVLKKDASRSKNNLAINGGQPARTKPWSEGPFHFPKELEALKRVFSGPALPLARGPCVTVLRELIAKTYGVQNVVTTSSGSTAIHVALAAAGVEPGDEVIVPPVTDNGSLIGILQLNAVAMFCDTIENGLTMDVDKLETVITKRTKAIMPVHIAGYPVDMPKLIKIARKYKIKVVEDCAQSHLAKIGNTNVGCFGDFGAFSTNESKHLKTGEGGFVLCRRKRDAEYADLFADKCYPRTKPAPRTPSFPSLNVRMSEINAAIACEQLKMLPRWVRQRHRAGSLIDKTLAKFPLVPHWRPAGAYCSYWWAAFSIDSGRTNLAVKDFVKTLNAEGIPCFGGGQSFLPGWKIFRALNDDPKCFATYRPGTLKKGRYPAGICPMAKRAPDNLMGIPVNQYTSHSEISDLSRALKNIFDLSS